MANFGDTFDRTGGVEFPFPTSVVFRAVQEAVGYQRMKVVAANALAGHLSLKTGASAMAWGEKISVSVLEAGPGRRRVEIQSAAKTMVGSATSHGKNRKNIDLIIITTTSAYLEEYGAWAEEMGVVEQVPSQSASDVGPSVADELLKLAGLRDAGVLTEAEFQQQKSKLLSQ